ncbi:MAG: acyltransferase [Paramuribaculum sp.]|nr:acyltransferase [Paramuribaculum sp.]MDE6488796.1 acyltransferase [Paramuribaculum sp.]
MSVTEQKVSSGRPRYQLLDGLRGVAALFVILYHFCEAFATSPTDQMFNHGYLAVDFFFVLSGFVIGYAYDGSWKKGMTPGRFMLRRVVRLQPMVILSLLLGVIAYLIQGSVRWDGTPVSLPTLAVALVLGMLLIPVSPGVRYDVRGNGEMFPLNGPSWSLFFEYIGSILYALVLRRLSDRWLKLVVFLSAAGLAAWAVTDMSGAYHLGVGWGMADWGFVGGFLRLSFSFSIGLLMQRRFRPVRIRGAFWICSALIAIILVCPYVGGPEPSPLNGIYDAVATVFIFPAVVWLGAGGTTSDAFSTRLCENLGELSYPVYIVHYPVMYLFYSWVWTNGLGYTQVWPVCCGLLVLIVLMAWASLRFYDQPVRRWLSARLLTRKRL